MQSIVRAMNWTRFPGNWDTLHLSQVFPSDNEYGIPTLLNNGQVPSRLVQWGSRPTLLATPPESNAAVHFFLDDYRFESLWNNPRRNLDALLRIGCCLTPDFSLWRDMPLAMQIWNTYRNRWLGCSWQAHGIRVIPTISWSQPYDFCYAGVEVGSIVAIATVGIVKDATARRLFHAGFERMCEVLRPSAIVSYGDLASLGIRTDVPVVTFPTRWQERKPPRQRKRSLYEQLSLLPQLAMSGIGGRA